MDMAVERANVCSAYSLLPKGELLACLDYVFSKTPSPTLVGVAVATIAAYVTYCNYRASRRAHLMTRLTEHNKLIADRLEWQYPLFHYLRKADVFSCAACIGATSSPASETDAHRDPGQSSLSPRTTAVWFAELPNLQGRQFLVYDHQPIQPGAKTSDQKAEAAAKKCRACVAIDPSNADTSMAEDRLRSATRGLHLSHMNLIYQAWLLFGNNMDERWERLAARLVREFFTFMDFDVDTKKPIRDAIGALSVVKCLENFEKEALELVEPEPNNRDTAELKRTLRNLLERDAFANRYVVTSLPLYEAMKKESEKISKDAEFSEVYGSLKTQIKKNLRPPSKPNCDWYKLGLADLSGIFNAKHSIYSREFHHWIDTLHERKEESQHTRFLAYLKHNGLWIMVALCSSIAAISLVLGLERITAIAVLLLFVASGGALVLRRNPSS